MKKTLAAFLVFFIFSSAISFAQMSVDPMHEFYEYVQIWQNKGIVSDVPLMRPYPVSNIKNILKQAIENASSEKDRKAAESFFEELTGKKYYFDFSAETGISNDDGNTDNVIRFNSYVQGDYSFSESDFAAMGYKAGYTVRTKDKESPFFTGTFMPPKDALHDPVELGPAKAFLDFNNSLAVGTKDIFIQTGIFRSGYGPFIGHGMAMNDRRFHSGNINFTYMNANFKYTQQFSVIGATRNSDLSCTPSGNKFTSFHGFEYEFSRYFSLSYYEASTFGGRFDPMYFIPVPFMVSQEIYGCEDNINMGIMFIVRPVKGISWCTDIYVDDFDLNKLAKLSLDSKQRIAARTGIIWTPDEMMIKKASLCYAAVTPYTYSHWQYEGNDASMSAFTVNYQNYTNGGIPIGSEYKPNTDAVEFSVELEPVERLNLKFSAVFSRHANVCQSLTDEEAWKYLTAEKDVYCTDGGIGTHSMFAAPGKSNGDHVDTAWNHLNWLTQDDVMTDIQLGFDAEYKLKVGAEKKKQVSVKCGLAFEYIKNYGVDRNMFEGKTVEVVKDADGNITDYKYKGTSYGSSVSDAQKKSIRKDVESAWREQLKDKTKLCFSIGFGIRF